MNRREVIALLASVAFARAAVAQRPKKVRIGFLATGSLASGDARGPLDAFRKGLVERGYVEGQSFDIEFRGADGKIERFPALANELVRLNVNVIVATNSLAARAAKQATTTIPIVVPIMGDPVGDGLVDSLARPGGNITGSTFLGPQLVPKRLALLKEALPGVSSVAALWHPGAYGEQTMGDMMKEAKAAAGGLGLQLRLFGVQVPDELDAAFSKIAAERADAVIVFPSPMLFTERRRIVDLAARHKLPSMSMGREFVEIGGLLSYGADITDMHRRIATYVDAILKGAKPAELPIEQPNKFDLAINLKSARALGIEFPPSLLARADEVIE